MFLPFHSCFRREPQRSVRLARASLAACVLLALSPPLLAQPITPPHVIEQPDADWPGEPGASDVFVPVVLTIAADGTVTQAEVTEARDPELDAAAVRTALRFRFTPARRDDTPIPSRIRTLVHFAAPPPVAPAPPAAAPATAPPPSPAAPAAPSPRAPAPPHAHPPIEIIVEGRTPRPSRGASDYAIAVGELARVPRKNAAELLKLAPGVHLTNEGGEGHAERIYLRGFDAREGQDIEITYGGIPVNESGNLHGNGFADLHFIIPELVRSLRVLEGPFDPHQGNYAVAGSVDYEPGLERRGLTARYTGGSFGSQRLLLTFGPPGESVRTFGGAEIAQSEGFGQNRDAKHASVHGQYEGRFGSNASFRVSGSGYANEYHSAGLLRVDDVEQGKRGFFDTYDTQQGGGGSRFQFGFDVEAKTEDFVLYQQLFAIQRGMRLRENLTAFLLDTQEAIQSPHGQRGDLFDMDMSETTVGARGSARTTGSFLGERQELELGYFARGDSVHGIQQRVDAAGIPYKTEVDLTSKLADLGLFADVALRPVKKLVLRGGLRADLFAYDVLDDCAVKDVSAPSPDDPPGDASCLDQRRGGEHREPNQRSSTASTKLMPRVSASFGPIQHFTFSIAYGQGVRSIDPSYITNDVETPFASVEAEEAGVTYARGFDDLSVGARSVFFRTHVDKDLVFSETEGRSVLGGGTTRLGWTGALRLTNDWLDENANVTLVHSAFDDDGLLVPYVPDIVIRSDTALGADLPVALGGRKPRGSAGLGVTYVGRRALPYGQRSETIFTLDASAALAFAGYELELEVMNLFDSRYRSAEYDYVSDFSPGDPRTLVPARHFAAGAPRSIFLSLSANFGGS